MERISFFTIDFTQRKFLPRVRRKSKSQQCHGGDEYTRYYQVEEVVQGATPGNNLTSSRPMLYLILIVKVISTQGSGQHSYTMMFLLPGIPTRLHSPGRYHTLCHRQDRMTKTITDKISGSRHTRKVLTISHKATDFAPGLRLQHQVKLRLKT